MIGIYLSPDETQIIQAKYEKNKKLKIETCAIIEPYFNYLRKCDVNFLIEMFEQVKQLFAAFYEEFYIILPDTIFLSIDCYDFRNDNNEKLAAVETRLNRKKEDFYTSFPLELQSTTRHKETMVVVDRAIVDTLIKAARAADIALLSIEPASFAYLRSSMQWRKEYYLLEMFQKEAAMIAFSPIAGMFRLSVPELDLSSKNTMDPESQKKAIQSVLIRCDAIANKTFENTNTDIPVTVLAGESDLSASILQNRREECTIFPDFVESDLDESEQRKFSIALGGLLQAVEKVGLDLYMSASDFLHVRSANILPPDVRQESRLQQVKRVTKKYSKIISCFLIGCIGLQLAGIFYFKSIVIPDSLQADYDKAQSQMEPVKREIELIQLSKTEHQYPIEALNGLLGYKPQNLAFSSIEVGRKGVNGGKDKDNKWINFVAKSNDPMVFRDFAMQLGENSLFNGINISQISTDTSGLKSATVFAGKGTVR